MSFAVLRNKLAPESMKDFILQHAEQYGKFGEFYEDLSNTYGGKDFLCTDLEAFLRAKNPEGKESGKIKDYSLQLVEMEGFSIRLLHTSDDAYLRTQYVRYAFYWKKK